MTRIEVGVLGATGTVGQQFAVQLARHPWFSLTWVAASERSEGRKYRDIAPWRLPHPIPEIVADRQVEACSPGAGPKLVFSALDASVAGDIEQAFASAGHIVVSNARNFRMDPVVPLLVPEVNADHLVLTARQCTTHGWRGAIVTNPNCSTVFLAMVLAALRPFDPRAVVVFTMQAVSGAGYPGVASLDILGNVIPFIGGEEEKMESETKKILGRVVADGVEPHPVAISAHTNRVAVINGHTEAISIGFHATPPRDEIRSALEKFQGPPQQLSLPSAPARPIEYLDEQNRPQPRLDVDRGNGMTVSIGRLRTCRVLDYKLVALGHNTIRGAAGAAVLNAELMHAQGKLV
jgi:aspartate-semialdehyde dehydrogenase